MTTPTAFSDRLVDLARTCYEDSARWFPELHQRPKPQIAAHYALGLIGELGEYEEAIFVDHDYANAPLELADQLVYSLDFAHLLGMNPRALMDSVAEEYAGRTLPPVLVIIGNFANATKKWNRGDDLSPPLRETIALALGMLLVRTFALANGAHVNLEAAYEAKHAELVRRWG